MIAKPVISVFPKIENESDWKSCLNAIEWYLEPLKEVNRIVLLSDNIDDFANRPAWLEVTQSSPAALASQSDYALFWKADSFWAAPAALRRKAIIVDPYARQAAGDYLHAFASNISEGDPKLDSVRFSKALMDYDRQARVCIIGPGKSANHQTLESLKAKFSLVTIYLGTTIFEEDLTDICPPDIVIASDGPSQFGPTVTAQRYRDCLLSLMRKHGTKVLIPAGFRASVRAHWPADIADKIYAVPIQDRVTYGNNIAKDWTYEPTSNVLTALGLPCAAAISSHIILAGITTHEVSSSPRHFSHQQEASYQRHVAPIRAMHPAAIMDRPEYLAEHFVRLEAELAAYRGQGYIFEDVFGDVIGGSKEVFGVPRKMPFKLRLFQAVEYWQHRPVLPAFFIFILAAGLGAASERFIGLRMTGFIIAGFIALAGFCTLYFMRLRMNRMIARLENRLSHQQASQFQNLSDRLKTLEDKD